jgi:hypothetical protein
VVEPVVFRRRLFWIGAIRPLREAGMHEHPSREAGRESVAPYPTVWGRAAIIVTYANDRLPVGPSRGGDAAAEIDELPLR